MHCKAGIKWSRSYYNLALMLSHIETALMMRFPMSRHIHWPKVHFPLSLLRRSGSCQKLSGADCMQSAPLCFLCHDSRNQAA